MSEMTIQAQVRRAPKERARRWLRAIVPAALLLTYLAGPVGMVPLSDNPSLVTCTGGQTPELYTLAELERRKVSLERDQGRLRFGWVRLRDVSIDHRSNAVAVSLDPPDARGQRVFQRLLGSGMVCAPPPVSGDLVGRYLRR